MTEGIVNARGEVIVTTDADCAVQPKWLDWINNFFQNPETKLVFGGVKIAQEGSFFSKLQSIEFSSLIGSGAATLGLGSFTMCNGANLAFSKEAFDEVSGYEDNLDIASGDDEFLARKIQQKYPASIRFLNHSDATVSTQSQPDLKRFIQQRLRWAGKWKYNNDLKPKVIAILMIVFQLAFIGIIVAITTKEIDLRAGLSLLGGKFLLESTFLIYVNNFLKSRWDWVSFCTLQLCYPFYVIGIGLLSQTGAYDWKGRRLSHKM